MSTPKLFISYSWTTPEHEQWVVSLAEEIVHSGVEVILDKWDLKEGHDAIKFMELMVNDDSIKKVLIICDKEYAERANNRKGGVGTEAQIMSKEIYENVSPDKFVAVVREKDERGNAYLPTYYNGRIYIDLCDSEKYAENFERLLRWIFDKPLYIKPKVGPKPSFLSEGEHISLGTNTLFRRCIESIKSNKPSANASLNEYLETFSNNLERFGLDYKAEIPHEEIVKNIEAFIPYRNEFIQLLFVVVQYSPTDGAIQSLHRFFESLIPYTIRGKNKGISYETDYDNFKFIVHELFLYTVAIFLKYEKFDQANQLFQISYYVPGNSEYGRHEMVDFRVFRAYLRSLETRNQQLDLGKLSLHAELLHERIGVSGLDFRYIMQADFVAFIRSELEPDDSKHWWPVTLLYARRSSAPFEIFARSISKNYFEKVLVLFGKEPIKNLALLMQSYSNHDRELPSWDYSSLNPKALLGYDKLGTRP